MDGSQLNIPETLYSTDDPIICDLGNMEIKCDICGSLIFPEQKSYCEHVMFVYVEDCEGFWAYVSKEARTDVLAIYLCLAKGFKLEQISLETI